MKLTVLKISQQEFPLDQPVNSYFINEINIVIDTGIRPPRLDADYYLVTHWHWDHTMGLTHLKNRRICMPKTTLEILERGHFERRFKQILHAGGVRISEIEKLFIAEMNRRYNMIMEALQLNEVLTVDECPLISKGPVKVIDCPGHSIDHACYIIGNLVFTGDTLIPGRRTTIIDFKEHRRTLLRLLSIPNWRILHPGHGDSMDREKALRTVEEHTVDRCNRVYRILSRMPRGEWITLDIIMEQIYGVKPSLRAFVALRTLTGYIKELEETGIIVVDRGSSPWRVRIRV